MSSSSSSDNSNRLFLIVVGTFLVLFLAGVVYKNYNPTGFDSKVAVAQESLTDLSTGVSSYFEDEPVLSDAVKEINPFQSVLPATSADVATSKGLAHED